MDTNNIAIAFTGVGVFYSLTIVLIKYIIVQKDKQAEKVGQNIIDIKELLSSIRNDSSVLKSELENTRKLVQSLTEKIDDINKTVHQMQVNQAALMEWRASVDKQLTDLHRYQSNNQNK